SARNVSAIGAAYAQHSFVFMRKYLDKAWKHVVPVFQNPLRPRAVGEFVMSLHEIANDVGVLCLDDWLQIHRRQVAAFLGEVTLLVETVRNASAHTRSEVAPARAEHYHQAVGHVFAAVITNTLDHRRGARVADCKALAGNAVEEHLAAGCAVEY